jgi:D-beta-D-heptose 7-phosphate kinase/D-beta-D-heptose 1-phosphate adenosyltransferase
MIKQLDAVIQKIEREWASKRVLVVGDVMLDKYIWGEVSRISPEAPVPVVLARHETCRPGGAANVAMNLAHLGAKVDLVGFVGADTEENLLSSSLRSNGVRTAFVQSKEFPTIAKMRIVVGRQQMLRLDTERCNERSADDHERLISVGKECLASCDALVLSDYAKGVLTHEACRALIDAANQRGIPILVDPKSVDFSRYHGATTICPNLGELSKVIGSRDLNLDQILSKAEELVASLGLKFLTATLSEKGIALIQPGNRHIAPAEARQVFDVSGAGDTVVAVLALCLASGLEPETGVQLANLAAGIVVGKVGTVPIEKHEILAALAPEIAIHAIEKVIELDELLLRIAFWRQRSERIVFTNGCFDLLHVGHIALLEESRRFGDHLIVAINSDSSVRSLKGPTRPIVNQANRARVLAALASVDAVVVFDDPTPIELINAIRPDFLVKGGDYTVGNVVGAREMESWGGEVRIIPIVEGHSTTQLINSTRTISSD